MTRSMVLSDLFNPDFIVDISETKYLRRMHFAFDVTKFEPVSEAEILQESIGRIFNGLFKFLRKNENQKQLESNKNLLKEAIPKLMEKIKKLDEEGVNKETVKELVGEICKVSIDVSKIKDENLRKEAEEKLNEAKEKFADSINASANKTFLSRLKSIFKPKGEIEIFGRRIKKKYIVYALFAAFIILVFIGFLKSSAAESSERTKQLERSFNESFGNVKELYKDSPMYVTTQLIFQETINPVILKGKSPENETVVIANSLIRKYGEAKSMTQSIKDETLKTIVKIIVTFVLAILYIAFYSLFACHLFKIALRIDAVIKRKTNYEQLKQEVINQLKNGGKKIGHLAIGGPLTTVVLTLHSVTGAILKLTDTKSETMYDFVVNCLENKNKKDKVSNDEKPKGPDKGDKVEKQ